MTSALPIQVDATHRARSLWPPFKMRLFAFCSMSDIPNRNHPKPLHCTGQRSRRFLDGVISCEQEHAPEKGATDCFPSGDRRVRWRRRRGGWGWCARSVLCTLGLRSAVPCGPAIGGRDGDYRPHTGLSLCCRPFGSSRPRAISRGRDEDCPGRSRQRVPHHGRSPKRPIDQWLGAQFRSARHSSALAAANEFFQAV